MIKKSISVTDQQDAWIKSQISKGYYGNDSEVIRELIRERQMMEHEKTSDIAAIRKKLEVAEESGFIDQTPQQMLAEFKRDLSL